MTGEELLTYLRSKEPRLRTCSERGGRHAKLYCPICNYRKSKTLSVLIEDSGDKKPGAWICHHAGCGSGGLNALLEAFGDHGITKRRDSPTELSNKLMTTRVTPSTAGQAAKTSSPSWRKKSVGKLSVEKKDNFRKKGGSTFDIFADGLDESAIECLWSSDGRHVKEYLNDRRKFSDKTIKEWKLGAIQIPLKSGQRPIWWVSIPVYRDKKLSNVRFRSAPTSCPYCSVGDECPIDICNNGTIGKTYRRCDGRDSTLFGADALSANKKTNVLITEGELDVIGLYEYGIKNAVSGTTGAKSFQDDWLDILEPYSGFVLLYGMDEAGNSGAKNTADRLGKYRCFRAKLPYKDVCECLEKGISKEEIKDCVNNAGPLIETKLLKVGDFEERLNIIIDDPDSLRGTTTSSAKLDGMLAGYRPEVIVVTGGSGVGKTSFVTWLMYEQWLLGEKVLLTSFEQTPTGTIQKLLRMNVGGDFTKISKVERSEAIARLNSDRLFIADHYGTITPQKTVDFIRFAVRRHDVRFVMIDHLHYVIPPSSSSDSNEGNIIHSVMMALAQLARSEGVTIFLIVHPNRNAFNQNRRVRISDLKGSSGIEQEAHDILVIESVSPSGNAPYHRTRAHLDKARSEFARPGSSCTFAFDAESSMFADEWSQTPSGKLGIVPKTSVSQRKNRFTEPPP